MLSRLSAKNISLPDDLRPSVDEKVARDVHAPRTEYGRELIGREPQRTQLRDRLLAGALSPASLTVGDAYFETLRQRVRQP